MFQRENLAVIHVVSSLKGTVQLCSFRELDERSDATLVSVQLKRSQSQQLISLA